MLMNWIVSWSIAGAVAQSPSLSESLLFHASFEGSADADFARGDKRLYTADSLTREGAGPGLRAQGVALAKDGRFGGCLTFAKKTEQVVFYRGGQNVPYVADGFGGAISFWMRLAPEADLPPGYVDPLQVTDKAWNDACIFVDFTEKNPRQFRLGIFSDLKFWNPSDRAWEEIPEGERPMVSVSKPPFSREQWTHVAITLADFNSPEGEAEAALYLDGQRQGTLRGKQRFTWQRDEVVIMLGIYYVGGIDDFAIFSRPLTEDEIGRLFVLPDGIRSIREN
jgi:hypothetical protein